jgi:hypothetical protein
MVLHFIYSFSSLFWRTIDACIALLFGSLVIKRNLYCFKTVLTEQFRGLSGLFLSFPNDFRSDTLK